MRAYVYVCVFVYEWGVCVYVSVCESAMTVLLRIYILIVQVRVELVNLEEREVHLQIVRLLFQLMCAKIFGVECFQQGGGGGFTHLSVQACMCVCELE